MSNKHPIIREGRLGGYAPGQGAGVGGAHPLTSIELEAIDNANRTDGRHNVAGEAVKYGSQPVAHLHQGEVVQPLIDAALNGHPDQEGAKDTR